MKKTIFGVFDRKVKEFVIIRDCVNIEDFKRWFTLALMDVPSIFSRFPEDYDIYTLALFDSETGALTTGDFPASLVCSVSELKVVPLNESEAPSDSELPVTASLVKDFNDMPRR